MIRCCIQWFHTKSWKIVLRFCILNLLQGICPHVLKTKNVGDFVIPPLHLFEICLGYTEKACHSFVRSKVKVVSHWTCKSWAKPWEKGSSGKIQTVKIWLPVQLHNLISAFSIYYTKHNDSLSRQCRPWSDWMCRLIWVFTVCICPELIFTYDMVLIKLTITQVNLTYQTVKADIYR